jgi:hypothetical protein
MLSGCAPKLNVPPMATFRQAAINSQYGRSSGDLQAPRAAQAYLASERERLVPIIKAAGLQPV